MNTHVINLFAGPGAGKSTLAAEVYAKLKRQGVSCELVREYVKDWAWEGRKISGFDQFYIAGKQIKRESSLYGKVRVIITDCPVWNSAFYEAHYENTGYLRGFCRGFYEYAEAHGVAYHNFLVTRSKPYDPHGRYENEDQAKAIDAEMADMLRNLGLPFVALPASDNEKANFLINAIQSSVPELGTTRPM